MAVRANAGRILGDDDRALLEAAVHSVGPRLLAYARRSAVRGGEAEDIVAETFCRAAANIENLRACENRDVYLFTIARNLCRDGFRRMSGAGVRGRERPLSRELAEARLDATPQPPELVALSEARDRAGREVAALPEELREVIVLRMSAGLKFEQIAALLGIPLGTALSRMRAALNRLRTRMAEEANHEADDERPRIKLPRVP